MLEKLQNLSGPHVASPTPNEDAVSKNLVDLSRGAAVGAVPEVPGLSVQFSHELVWNIGL